MTADQILFTQFFNGKRLFSNQQELVTTLLNDPDTRYYIPENDQDKYQKALSRLKAYVSQLLSNSVARSITEDFKHGLQVVIGKKLVNSDVKHDLLIDSIIADLRNKNLAVPRTDTQQRSFGQFSSDLSTANYIAVITSKPLEIDVPFKASTGTFQKFFFEDLIDRLSDPMKDLKYYRFNFPTEAYGLLFWQGLRRVLLSFIKEIPDTLFESLYQKFVLKTETIQRLKEESLINVENIVSEILRLLNRNGFILVFYTNAPIYGLPLVALDPSESKNAKVYAILDRDELPPLLYKFPHNECLLWRVFVWDQLKAKTYAGKQITYPQIEDSIEER